MRKKSVGSILEHTANVEKRISAVPMPGGEILLFRSEDGSTRVECRFVDEQIWLTQKLMGELFQVTVPSVNEHLKGIYDDGDLDPATTIRKFRIVRSDLYAQRKTFGGGRISDMVRRKLPTTHSGSVLNSILYAARKKSWNHARRHPEEVEL